MLLHLLVIVVHRHSLNAVFFHFIPHMWSIRLPFYYDLSIPSLGYCQGVYQGWEFWNISHNLPRILGEAAKQKQKPIANLTYSSVCWHAYAFNNKDNDQVLPESCKTS